MSMKVKILLTVLPVMIVSILIMNMSFGIFFQDFIMSNETERIHTSALSIKAYMNEISTSFKGTVNDWAHWDDTYYFMMNQNQSYVDSNLTVSALQSINSNFLLYVNLDDSIMYEAFLNTQDEVITEFPPSLINHSNKLIDYSKHGDDTSGVIKLGDKYYFVATSHITDSIEIEEPIGILIIGREIDQYIYGQMEAVSGLDLSIINIWDKPTKLRADSSSIIGIHYDEDPIKPIQVEILVLNDYDLDSSIVIEMAMSRTSYLQGMKHLSNFAFINTIISLILSILIFLFLGMYITKPFARLIQDVKLIDTNDPMVHKLSERGNDEFSFLRKMINSLMEKIAINQAMIIKSKEEMYTTLLSIGEGIITVDPSGSIVFLNLVAEKMTGWALDSALNKDLFTVLDIKVPNDAALDLVDRVYEANNIVEFTNNLKLLPKNGDPIDVEITASPVKDQLGNMTSCIFVIKDVTEKNKKQRHIEYLRYQDILTGLFNRSYYEERIDELESKESMPLSLILIDVDGLKLTNDAFGHESGDQLLIKVANCIKKSVRSDDIVCRVGGDEFVIILPQKDNKETIQVINRIHSVIEREKNQNMPVSISSGWATKQKQSESIESIFRIAEDMMYHNKSSAKKSKRLQTIQVIMKTLFKKNPIEEAHSKRVSGLSVRIGESMNLDISNIKNLQTAALLHDIGKIGVDNQCLNKIEPLNNEEWLKIKKHPQIGYNILSSVNEYGPLANIVLYHHERWDGNGYPSGLKEEEIPLESRIIAVADAYDTMISDQVYRKGMNEIVALRIIESEAGKQFDPLIVRIFLDKVINQY